jgi:hypothetical protein
MYTGSSSGELACLLASPPFPLQLAFYLSWVLDSRLKSADLSRTAVADVICHQFLSLFHHNPRNPSPLSPPQFIANPRAFLSSHRQSLGDTFVARVFGVTLLCTFSPRGLRSLYEVREKAKSTP